MASVQCMAMRRSLACVEEWVEEITSHPAASGGTTHHIYEMKLSSERKNERKKIIQSSFFHHRQLFSNRSFWVTYGKLRSFDYFFSINTANRKVNCSKSQEKKVLLISFRWVSELYVELLLRRARVLNDSKVASSKDRTKHFTISNLWPRSRFPGSLKEMGELSEIIKDFTRRRCTFLGLMVEKITRCLRKAPK